MYVAQQVIGNGQEVFPVRRHKSVIADFDKFFGKHMLKEPMNEIRCRQSGRFPLMRLAVFKTEGHLAVFEFFDSVVGNSHSVEVRGEVF